MRLSDWKPSNAGAWLIGALMVLVPIQYYALPEFGQMASRVSQQQVFQVVSLSLFSIFLLNNVWMSLFMLWTLFLYAYFGFPNPVGVVLLTITSGCIIYEAVYRVVNRENIRLIVNAFIVFAIINLAYMAMQGLGWELLFSEQSEMGVYQRQMIGFFNLKAIMGMFFAMVMPFVAFRYPITAIGLLVPLYLSECSSAMVAGIVVYLHQIWYLSKKWFFILLAILTIGGIAYSIRDSHTGMFTDRFNMWKTVLRDAVKKPVMGWGPDSFRSITPDKQFMYWKNNRTLETSQIDVRDTIEYSQTKQYSLEKYGKFLKTGDSLNPWDNPHNEYIQLFYEFGIIGVVLLGFLSFDIFKRFDINNVELLPVFGFFIGLAIMSIGQFPLHLARVGVYVPIFLACYYKLSDDYE